MIAPNDSLDDRAMSHARMHAESSSDPSPAQEVAQLQKVEELPAFSKVQHGDLLELALSANTTSLTHGLHRFPAKYIPQIPRWALREFGTRDSIVLDPFMGSGTTLVEGLCAASVSYGIDVDPLARLISRAKTAAYDMERIVALSEQLFASERTRPAASFLPMHGVANVEHWFGQSAWSDLCVLFRAIDLLPCSLEEREFFLAVFSSILRVVSNADDQTQKTYVSGTLKKSPPPVWDTFRRFLGRAINGARALEDGARFGSAKILDATALDIPLPKASVDLVVTSPPYLDSVDYMYNFMLEYFWLGPYLGVPSRADFNRMRRAPVGAKNPTLKTGSMPSSITELVAIGDMPKYRRAAVVAYFEAMNLHFEEASRVLKRGGRYVLVVGNSQAQTGVIPVHDCLLRVARAAGLHMEKAFAYRIRRHYMKFPRKGRGGIILMDWVITLRKTGKALLPIEDRLPMPNVKIGNDEVAN